jgi:hypothetical protein
MTTTAPVFPAGPRPLRDLPAAAVAAPRPPAERPNVAFGALDAPNATLGAPNATNATLGRIGGSRHSARPSLIGGAR